VPAQECATAGTQDENFVLEEGHMNSNHVGKSVGIRAKEMHETDLCAMLVADSTGWKLAESIDVDLALTVLATCSEDPADWSELTDYWPRYRTPVVLESAESIPMENTDREAAAKLLSSSYSWLFIDLLQKRVLCSETFEPVKRDQVFSLSLEHDSREEWPLSIHLAPWWQLQQPAEARAILEHRSPAFERPRTDRTILYGPTLLRDLSGRILQAASSQTFNPIGATSGQQTRYRMTVQVHRDWLMTPRIELQGKTPREHLHGGLEWIRKLVHGQELRHQEGFPLLAAPTDVTDYFDAPMGLEEVCTYFDLCRALIDAGWSWVASHPLTNANSPAKLVEYLSQVQQRWMNERREDDSPPSVIIECSRRRVPRVVGEEIIGIPNHQVDRHLGHCDCPICEMLMEADVFGPTYIHIDGHHLELDDEFAFSLCETREEWESERELMEKYFERTAKATSESGPDENESGSDEFASVWRGFVSDDPIPGDANGYLKLAFLFAEIIAALRDLRAPDDTIADLNHRFRCFRKQDVASRDTLAAHFKSGLEDLVTDYPKLTSRLADLQSRVDESMLEKSRE
jgi:hypothetical protein